MNALGTTNLEKTFDELAGIIEDGYSQFRDGIQIWDLAFIPKALRRVVLISKLMPEAIKEAKDLQIEEIAELVGYLVNRIMAVFDSLKTAPPIRK